MEINFKRTNSPYNWAESGEKGYTPYINGKALPYYIEKCDLVKDWNVFSSEGAGDYICGGLTFADAKQSFINFYTKH